MDTTLRLSFTGHESFHCRHFWPKKGYDFVTESKSFNEPAAVVDLGVGKNMVASIRYWMRSFGLLNEDEALTPLATKLLKHRGWDPFLENEASLWLLHYLLVTTGRASLYDIFFNEYRRERYDFTRTQLESYLRRLCEDNETQYSQKSLATDIKVFLRSYARPSTVADIEEDYSSLLLELDLVKRLNNRTGDSEDVFRVEPEPRDTLPHEIVLYNILDQTTDKTISLRQLHTEKNLPGMVFCLSFEGLYQKVQKIVSENSGITLSETAGVQVLQFKQRPDPLDVLSAYYKK